MTGPTLKLPLGSKPEMVSPAALFANYPLLDTIVTIMLSASHFVRKPLKKIQSVHVVFLAKKHPDYAKLCRPV